MSGHGWNWQGGSQWWECSLHARGDFTHYQSRRQTLFRCGKRRVKPSKSSDLRVFPAYCWEIPARACE